MQGNQFAPCLARRVLAPLLFLTMGIRPHPRLILAMFRQLVSVFKADKLLEVFVRLSFIKTCHVTLKSAQDDDNLQSSFFPHQL